MATPFISPPMQVEQEWTDYNGHLNMAYYHLLFDRAVDAVLVPLGLGPEVAAETGASVFTAQTQVHYLRELQAGDSVVVETRLIEHDSKRLHYVQTMRRVGEDDPAAISENLVLAREAACTGWRRRLGREREECRSLLTRWGIRSRFAWLGENGMEGYHALCFETTRQLGVVSGSDQFLQRDRVGDRPGRRPVAPAAGRRLGPRRPPPAAAGGRPAGGAGHRRCRCRPRAGGGLRLVVGWWWAGGGLRLVVG